MPVRPSRPPPPSRAGEAARVGLLAAIALILYSPYLTSRQMGGADARWYATVLTDYLHQLRAGHFPILTGEGRYNWTGGVHPYRTGPIFMNLAGLWDGVLLGRGTPFLLAHLTVLTSALVGTLGAYFAFVAFLPRMRWEAFALALIYLTSPTWLALIAGSEAYMSFMVFAIMPLILYGNARALTRRDGPGYLALGVGLALGWMGHVPIANACLLASLGLQVGSLVCLPAFPLASAGACIGWFLLLDAYFFATLSDLPPWQEHPIPDVVRALAFCAFFVGFAKGILRREGPGWLALGAAGLVIGAALTLPWLVWFAVAAVLALAADLTLRRIGRIDARRHGFDVLFFSLLAAAWVAARLVDPVRFGRNTIALDHYVDSAREFKDVIRPFGWDGFARPGVAVLALLVFVLLVRWTSRSIAARLFSAAVIVFTVFAERVPGVSDFIVGYFPRYLASLSTMTLTLRLIPPLVGFIIMAAVLALGSFQEAGRRTRVVLGVSLGLLSGAATIQAWYFVRANRAVTASERTTAQSLRPENIPTYRYDYDYVKVPLHHTDGVSDPALECRFLDDAGRVLGDSRQAALASEALGEEVIRLQIGPKSPAWVQFSPMITVGPAEQVLVRFEFDPAVAYSGWFFLFGDDVYREYQLPFPGYAGGFGSAPGAARVIKLWNSTAASQIYHLSYRPEPGSELPPGAAFATLHVSRLAVDHVPVDLKSLTPFTAVVRAPQAVNLETCRAFIPGYVATVDGRRVPVSRSPEGLLQLPVPAGEHRVVVAGHLTARDIIGFWVSAAGWLALGWVGIRAGRRR